MVSENRHTSPKIDVFQMTILTLLVPVGNNAQASFLVHQVQHTSATVAVSPNVYVYTVFPPHYPNLLYLAIKNLLLLVVE